MALEGSPLFIKPQEGVDQGVNSERAIIGHFQTKRLAGKLG